MRSRKISECLKQQDFKHCSIYYYSGDVSKLFNNHIPMIIDKKEGKIKCIQKYDFFNK